MRILWTAVIPILSLAAGVASAAVCEPRALAFKGLEERAFEIAFPDGKRVLVVGEIHGDRAVNKLAGIARDESQSKETFMRNIAILSAEQADAIAHARVNMDFLIALRKQFADVKLVAMEATPETTEQLKAVYPKVLDAIEARAEAVGVGRESVQEVVLPAFGAAIYLHVKVPQVLAGLELAGIESAQALAQEMAAYEKMGAADAKFRALAAGKPELLAKEGEMIDFLLAMYGAEDRRGVEARAKIRAKLEADFPKELQPAMAEVITAELVIGDYRDRRDEHTATVLSSRKGSSVFFVGRDHLRALSAKLTRKCAGG